MGNFNISVKLKYARGFLCKIWKVNSLSNSNKNLLLSEPSEAERNCIISKQNCFTKLSTSLSLFVKYLVDIFYWLGWKEACLGQVYCNSNIQPGTRLLNSLCKYCVPSDTGSSEQCTIRLEWFNKYHLISQ